jgi:hypothetical protein
MAVVDRLQPRDDGAATGVAGDVDEGGSAGGGGMEVWMSVKANYCPAKMSMMVWTARHIDVGGPGARYGAPSLDVGKGELLPGEDVEDGAPEHVTGQPDLPTHT